MSDPRAVIEAIRARWLEGDPFHQEQLKRVAPHVAERLYPSVWTFVRELIQNADDCDYPLGEQPKVLLRRSKEGFQLVSNEVGFTEPNVRAICSFASSTKSEQKWRFIGEKGLGFKSSFRVSEQPEVHSRGYHFRFDATQHEGLGRVIPQWIEDCAEREGTTIVLPFHPQLKLGAKLPDPLDHGQCILLFLRKLDAVEYLDEVSKRRVMLERKTDGSVVRMRHRVWLREKLQKETIWDFRKTSLVVDVSHAPDKDRKGIDESPVTVALPVAADGKVQLDLACWSYAYLPIAKTNFRFALNADLLLDTARGSPMEDNKWNAALCSGLGRCLANTVMQFCGAEASGGLALGALRAPPSLDHRLFQLMLQTAAQSLRTQRCVPTASGKWVLPDQVLLPDPQGLSELVDPSELARQAQMELIHPSIEKARGEVALLGGRSFGLSDLLKCLEDTAWMESRPSRWFSLLYAKLGRLELSSRAIAALKRTPILRMSDGSTVSAEGRLIFSGISSTHQYGFEKSMPLLASEACGVACKKFLSAIGVTESSARTVVDEYILPRHEAFPSSKLSDEEIIAHTCYIIDHIDSYRRSAPPWGGNPIGKIMAKLRVLTRSTQPERRVRHKASNMYLGAAYDDRYKLEKRWGDRMPERFISPRYKEAPAPEGARRGWAKFFKELRARNTPAISISKSGEPFHYGWAPESKALFQAADECQVWDFLSIVGSAWDVYAEPMTRRAEPLDETALVKDLRLIKVTTTRGQFPLSDCLLDTPENREVFGDDRPYLLNNEAESVFENSEFADACQVTLEPTVEEALNRLREIASAKATDEQTFAQVQRIYTYLAGTPSYKEHLVRSAFEDSALLLSGDEQGRWVMVARACWRVGGNLECHCPLRELAPAWELRAPELKKLFVQKLGVPESLPPQAWLQVLRSVRAAKEPMARAREFVRLAYRALAAVVDTPAVAPILNSLRSDRLLFNAEGGWFVLSKTNQPVVFSDDSHIEAQFAGKPGVTFMWVDPSDRQDVEPLFRSLAIKSLSEVMDVQAITGRQDSSAPSVAERLSVRMSAIARVLYHDAERPFDSALANGFFVFLANARVVISPKFRVTVGAVSIDCSFDAKILGKNEARTLHLRQECVDHDTWHAIGYALADDLGLDSKDGTWLSTLLACETESEVERILLRSKCWALPVEAQQQLPRGTSDRLAKSLGARAESDTRNPSPAASRTEGVVRAEHARQAAVGLTRPPGTESREPSHTTGPRTRSAADAAVRRSDPSEFDEAIDDEVTTGISDTGSLSGPSGADESGRDFRGRYRRARIIPREAQSYSARALIATMPVDDELIAEVEAAAVAFVLEEERAAGREAVDANLSNPANPGYDIRSVDPRTDSVRFIEVKGTKNEWGEFGVVVTSSQLKFAFERREQSWLYVVECALHEQRRKCHRIQDFAMRVEGVVVDGSCQRLSDG